MKTVKKQIIISFIVLSMNLLFSCMTTKNTTITEIENESNSGKENDIETEIDSNTGKDFTGTESETSIENVKNNTDNDSYYSNNQEDAESQNENEKISRSIIGVGIKSQKELYKFFMKNNKKASKRKVKRLAKYYIEESNAEGINSDVAFVQMCHETGFLRFGNLVTENMNNFCGLGSMDSQHRGEEFKTEQLGVRAHIQHLQAYATTEDVDLHKELVDPRYSWVHKTKFVTDIFGLAGTWATDPDYGTKLDTMLRRLEDF